jgi:superfamily II DNA or RNA helicase
MIDKGILSQFKVYATGHPDLKNVKTVAGDYHEGQLSEAMQAGTLSADIVKTWMTKWGKDKTLCFGVDCAHAQALQARFIEAGISCGYQDARTPPDERAEIKRKFHDGSYPVVTNVGTLTTGVDWDVRCSILARPTKSEMLYKQIIGRALRTAEGKDYALILDHSDTTQRLGFVTDIEHDHLHDGKEKAPAEPRERLPKECKACTALKPAGVRKCPYCGFEPVVVSNIVEDDGELQEISPGMLPKKLNKYRATMAEKEQFLSELKLYAAQHGYKPGWASNKFRDKFDCWPGWTIKDVSPANFVTLTTAAWIRKTQRAWVMSHRQRDNHGSANRS